MLVEVSSLPLISVLIPCHNAAPWLKGAVDSVCAQSIRNLEILIYDDGSTDGSGKAIDRLAATDPRIVVMGEATNRGIVHALNAMLQSARGAFIARMDADDISLPQRFEQQLRFIEAGNADLCGTWFQEFGGGPPRTVRWQHKPDELRAAMLFQNTICHPTVMARREVFEAFRYRENFGLAEDYDLFVRASEQFRLANVSQVLLRYRRHHAQATQAQRAEMEEVTCRIRINALHGKGIDPSIEQQRIHNLVRAPRSVRSLEDFELIEMWLLELIKHFHHPDAQRVVASQWTRAAIRAAPLGMAMWRTFHRSSLQKGLGEAARRNIDLAILAALRLDYESPAFKALRRLGLSV